MKVNDIKLTPESILKVGELLAGEAGTKVRLTVLHSGSDKPEVIELTRERFVNDPATGELLYPLRAAIQERLDKAPATPDCSSCAPSSPASGPTPRPRWPTTRLPSKWCLSKTRGRWPTSRGCIFTEPMRWLLFGSGKRGRRLRQRYHW